MLKKLNGKITKLLFYIKNNFLYFVFKSSVIATMLILIYLVCVLSQPNVARSNENTDVRPIGNSQKLMLTISTEAPSSFDSLFTTFEPLTTIDNYIAKTREHLNTHPLFPLEEQTTTPLVLDQTTKSSLEHETITETSIIPNPESTVLFDRSSSIEWQTTTESLKKETTPTSTAQYIEENEEIPSTSSLISTTTDMHHESLEIQLDTTPSPTNVPDSDNLFMDNWHSDEQLIMHDDIQTNSPEEIPFSLSDIKEPLPESFFQNEDDESSTLIATSLPTDEPGHSIGSSEEKKEQKLLQLSFEDMKNSHEDLLSAKFNKNKFFALKTPSIFSPDNLLNLFNMDHIPANSNRKAVWWSKSKNAPINAPAAEPVNVKNRKRQVKGIHPIHESEDVHEPPRIFDQGFNRKLKDSVNFLEQFFGNLMTQ